MDLRNIPEEVLKETPEYKCLQSQFSLLYNESLNVKTQLDEARALLLTAKNAHLRQIEHMEVTEMTGQKWLLIVISEYVFFPDNLNVILSDCRVMSCLFRKSYAPRSSS